MKCLQFLSLIVWNANAADIPPKTLDAQIFHESTCRPGVIHVRTHAIGLGQILPGGSASEGLPAYQLLEPSVNIRLTAQHLRRCFLLCGNWAGAVRVYGGHRKCKAERR